MTAVIPRIVPSAKCRRSGEANGSDSPILYLFAGECNGCVVDGYGSRPVAFAEYAEWPTERIQLDGTQLRISWCYHLSGGIYTVAHRTRSRCDVLVIRH